MRVNQNALTSYTVKYSVCILVNYSFLLKNEYK